MDDTKLDLEDLNSPCRELFVRSLGFVLALAVPLAVFLCVYWGINSAVHILIKRGCREIPHAFDWQQGPQEAKI